MVALRYEGEPLRARSRRAGAAAGAASLFLEVGEVGERAAIHRARRGRASGSCAATTSTAIRGASSASPVTDASATARLAGRTRRSSRRAADAAREELLLRAAAAVRLRAGQHVDVRLTAPDGYQAQRSYSIASRAGRARDRACDRAARRRRGVTVLSRGRRGRRRDRAARADRRAFHLGSRRRRTDAPDRRRLRRRAADDDDPRIAPRRSARRRCCCCSRRGPGTK